MISKKIIIKKELMNPDFVVTIAKTCSAYNSSITMYAKAQTVNLKSIVNIFGTRLENDEEVEVVFDGNDEAAACEAICSLFQIESI